MLFLLFAPLLKLIRPDVVEPKVTVLLDYSQSVVGLKDSASQKAFYQNLQDRLTQSVDNRYELIFVPFGDNVFVNTAPQKPTKRTNITAAVNAINDLYMGENHIASILVSDGIVTSGASPELVSTSWRNPVYTIGVGDTTVKRDVKIKTIVTNDVAFLGNTFPVRLHVSGERLSQDPLTIKAFYNGKEVDRWVRSPITGTYYEQFDLLMKADKPGNFPITVTVSALKDEEQTSNNTLTKYIEVLDNKQEILLFAGAPHPDVAALNNALKQKENIQITMVTNESVLNRVVEKSDLLILHDPFSSTHGRALWQKASSLYKPMWFIQGRGNLSNSELNYMGMSASAFSKTLNEAEPILNTKFQSFSLDAAQLDMVKKAPPLITPFNRYKLTTAKPLMYQQIGSVKTDQVLWTVNDQGHARTSFTAGVGLWKWRMYEFRRLGSHRAFDELVASTVQFLSIRKDKRRFVVKPVKQLVNEGEEVLFQGSLLNRNLQKTTEPDVRINLFNGKGEFVYTMSKDSQNYFASIKGIPPGKYSYNGAVEYDGERLFSKGSFTVKEVLLETYNTVANHFLLRQISRQTGGKFYGKTNYSELVNQLNKWQYPSLKVSESWYRDFIHLRWFFFLLALTLAVEWFLRKFWGSY